MPKKEKSTMSKAGFIRSCPATDSAAEVVEKGAAVGLKFSAQVVHATRSAARKKNKAPKTRVEILKDALVKTGKVPDDAVYSPESHFVALVGNIGLSKAHELLGKVQSTLQGI